MFAKTFILLSILAPLGTWAKTGIGGCLSKSTTNEYGYAVLTWYVSDTYEVCEILDCGGGRAPPKTTVPGCPTYEGTETYSPRYLTDMMTLTAETTATVTASEVTETAMSLNGNEKEGQDDQGEDAENEYEGEVGEEEAATETSDPVTIITAAPSTPASVESSIGTAGAAATETANINAAGDKPVGYSTFILLISLVIAAVAA